MQSAVNIGGGFTITQRMLDMFKRPGDPEEHNEYMALPAAATIAAYAAGSAAGEPAEYLSGSLAPLNLLPMSNLKH